MTTKEFLDYINNHILFLDGATGTELAKLGMPHNVCPEQWCIENPYAIQTVQKNYEKAGSNIVYAPTFGANRFKLKNFGLQDKTAEINKKLAEISKGTLVSAKVFGDIAPTGHFVQPFGDDPIPFETAVDIYKEQAQALLDGGVDGFAIETMMDIQEARAALIAIRELDPDIPVIVTMTFDQDGRTLTGNTPAAAIVTLQALGATAVGCNCSTGPSQMAKVIAEMAPFARVPLVAKPNAGMPRFDGTKTIFDMGADDFAQQVSLIVQAGASIIGGCCGTTPDHIAKTTQLLKNTKPTPIENKASCISSARKSIEINPDKPFEIIGERINPTGKKALQQELKEGKLNLVRDFARQQTEAGANILDVNMGMPGIDEAGMMVEAIQLLVNETDAPLCIDTTKPEVAEAALRIYPGRALFNSISAESDRINKVLPIAAKYGAMIVVLPLDDNGIPETTEERIQVAEDIMATAQKIGYEKRDFVVDGLVMTVSADPNAAIDTLNLIQWAASQKLNTVCGLSNVSFGLPRRDLVNRAFLAMAIAKGLNLAIANPMLQDITETAHATDVLVNRDANAKAYIAKYAQTTAQQPAKTETKDAMPTDKLRQAVLEGDDNHAEIALKECLEQKHDPKSLVDDILIPAITAVGDKFERKEYFLPQLLASAKTMRNAMATLEPLLSVDSDDGKPKENIVIATVKGDMHDIGKNIVALMLRNYNFNVIDLGRDVPEDVIIDAAVEHKVKIVCLSALMTTTMTEMKTVIEHARSRGLDELEFIVGGAVLNEDYANTIGAHYASDAMGTVRLAQSILQKD